MMAFKRFLGIATLSLAALGCTNINSQPVETGKQENRSMSTAANRLQSVVEASTAQLDLIAAYPEHLSHFEGNELVWKDKSRMVWDDGRTKDLEALLDQPDLEDMFGQAYPYDTVLFDENFDPGRCRPDPFFMKIYGHDATEVESNLVDVNWFGEKLKFNKQNGAADSLGLVARDLTAKAGLLRYLKPCAGTFNWRKVAGTTRLSNHSFGIAIDLNVAHAHYWRWSAEFKAGKSLVWKNNIPMEIVHAFERHGFIWGGKWYHYDTMHFEFRPELCRQCLNRA